jgi:hypothetical protein
MIATVNGLAVGLFMGPGCGHFDVPGSSSAIVVFLTGAVAGGRLWLLPGVPHT